MSREAIVQPVPVLCEPEATTGALSCPLCGGGMVPLRGQWRCSRCYFALCAGCEPVLHADGPDTGE
jgi:hypothetical protein